MSVYAGIDVHRKRSQVAVIDTDGEVLATSRREAIASARLKNDKGRCRDLGPAAARGPAAGGVDRPAAGAPAAGAAAPRVALVRLRTLLRNRIHAIVAEHGYDRPAGCWSGPGRAWLAALELPVVCRELLDDGRGLTGALQERIGRLDGEIRHRARSDARVKVLTQLPGTGRTLRHPASLPESAGVATLTRTRPCRQLVSFPLPLTTSIAGTVVSASPTN